MVETVVEAAQRVIERHAPDLATAGTTQAVEELVPRIAEEIGTSFDAKKDRFSYRAVIIILGLVVILVASTYAIYALTPIKPETKLPDLPDALISLGSAAIGALAGLLAPAPH